MLHRGGFSCVAVFKVYFSAAELPQFIGLHGLIFKGTGSWNDAQVARTLTLLDRSGLFSQH